MSLRDILRCVRLFRFFIAKIQHVDEAVNRWSKCDEVYYGKERDMKNFPTVKYSMTHPKVRLGFLPDSWFQALYPKTGVTGILWPQ